MFESWRDFAGFMILLLSAALLLYLCIAFSWYWAFAFPLFAIAFTNLAILVVNGNPSTGRGRGRTLSTFLLTTDNQFLRCWVDVSPGDIHLTAGKQADLLIPIDQISELTPQSQTPLGASMPGFSVDFQDSFGAARLFFFNKGSDAQTRTRNQLELLRKSQEEFYPDKFTAGLPSVPKAGPDPSPAPPLPQPHLSHLRIVHRAAPGVETTN